MAAVTAAGRNRRRDQVPRSRASGPGPGPACVPAGPRLAGPAQRHRPEPANTGNPCHAHVRMTEWARGETAVMPGRCGRPPARLRPPGAPPPLAPGKDVPVITSTVVICDRVDPYDLFAAARRVAGNPPRWREHDFGDIRMLRTIARQGVEAQVGVHFPAAGGLYRADGTPRGYAVVTFANSGFCSQRGPHERLVAALGELLAAGGLSWTWQYEDGPWQPGPRARGRRRPPRQAEGQR